MTADLAGTTPLRVGDVLYGYCGGWFGSDSYEDKRVEAIGMDWVVAREQGTTRPVFAICDPDSYLAEYRAEGTDQ